MKVALLTSRVMHYRIPFFNALVSKRGWSLEVLHSGDAIPAKSRLWDERILPLRSIGPLRLQGWKSMPRDSDANVVMFDIHWPMALLFGLWRRRETPLLWWGHGLGSSKGGRLARRRLAALSDGIIAYGYRGRGEFLANGIPETKVHVAPNTMWVEESKDMSTRTKAHFLFVGRFQRRKGLADLIRAYARIHDRTDLNLVLVGEGPIRSDLETLASQEKVADRVLFAGAIYDPAVLRGLFEQAIAYVSPGHVGLGVLHAFAFGVPVVTGKERDHAPEVEWVKDGKTGILVMDRPLGLSSALDRLARDRGLAENLGRGAFETYHTEASPDRMLDGFSGAVEAAVRSRAGSGG